MTRIDAHQHYWTPERGDYDWMPMDNAVLARSYQPSDLEPTLARHNIDKTVLVQAAATVQETDFILGIAEATDSVAGVVGWVDFENPDDLAHLQRLAKHPKFCGVRPMIQDIKDVNWMLRDDVQWAFQALVDLDLTLDALGFSCHLSKFHMILTRYPNMRVVIDHCMKPQIRNHPADYQFWCDGMKRLAKDTNACVKLSGLVTETNDGWDINDLRPYADLVLTEFGANRVMWGSDWPVCQLQASYDQWLATAQDLTRDATKAEKARIFGGTASEFYRLTL
ncbi:MAG: amidohydrolase family protein [Rhodobacteraceae bacterium]|nr:amidohydrolase family protein [Paracoccaceae bacterium]